LQHRVRRNVSWRGRRELALSCARTQENARRVGGRRGFAVVLTRCQPRQDAGNAGCLASQLLRAVACGNSRAERPSLSPLLPVRPQERFSPRSSLGRREEPGVSGAAGAPPRPSTKLSKTDGLANGEVSAAAPTPGLRDAGGTGLEACTLPARWADSPSSFGLLSRPRSPSHLASGPAPFSAAPVLNTVPSFDPRASSG
jgi:hypothetical protein